MKTCGIYAIVVGNYQYMYVGQSINIEKRLQNHLSLLRAGKHYNTKMQNVFNKYGEKCFYTNIVEQCDCLKLNEREQYYILNYGTFVDDNNNFGLNLTTGGEGRKQTNQTTEEIEKRKKSHALFVEKNPDFYKNVVGEILKDKYAKNDFLRNRQSEKMKAMHENLEYHKHYLEIRQSEEWRNRMSEKHKGKKVTEETKKKISKASGKKVLCENGMIFESARKAAQWVKEQFGLIVNVQAVCSGARKTAAGLKFQWLNNVASTAAG